jgi:cytochrome c553
MQGLVIMKRTINLLALAVAAMATLAGAGCADLSRSRDLANPSVSAKTIAEQVCSNCHGLTGNSVSPNFPRLAGQVDTYFASQLSQFKSHGRQDPAGFEYMWGLSRALTDEQISGLATYYSAQKSEAIVEATPQDQLAAGRAIFEQGVAARNIPACSSCHGAEGKGLATFPRLASQHADYLVKQLLVFQRTDERPEGSIMKTVAHELTEQDIHNVAAYAQSLHD